MSSKNNPWKYVQVDPARIENNPFLNPKKEPDPPLPPGDSEANTGQYIFMCKTNSYAKGVHALRQACEQESNAVHPQFTRDDGSKIYCPLTFKYVLESRVNDYEINKPIDDLTRLFNHWINSCVWSIFKVN